MTKKEWQQYSFVSPVHLDIGIAKPRAKRRRKRAANPDQAAVNIFLGQQRRALYDETGQTPMSNLLSLTSHQLQVYYARQADAAKEAAAVLEQERAEKEGLIKETFYLDQEIQLAKRCGCDSFFVRYTVVQKFGRSKHSGQTRLLVNDYCPSCGFEATGREYHFWVPNSQIIKRE